jgi:hypothetical protein
MIGLDLGGFSLVRDFASKIAGPRNTIKFASNDFLCCPLLAIEVLRLYIQSGHDRTGFGRIPLG